MTNTENTVETEEQARDNKCRRCGVTGTYSKGMVVNGVCFGCGGSGIRRVVSRASGKLAHKQWYALVDAEGRHLAINNDLAELETKIKPMCPTAIGIVPIER